MLKMLTGHNSPETAYIVDDYPYGFKLRCKMRCWIETNKNGQRYWTQTTNPKVAGEVWNKPKSGTYSDIIVMFLDDDNHVKHDAFNVISSTLERINAFVQKYEAGFDERATKLIALARKMRERESASVAKTLSGGSS